MSFQKQISENNNMRIRTTSECSNQRSSVATDITISDNDENGICERTVSDTYLFKKNVLPRDNNGGKSRSGKALGFVLLGCGLVTLSVMHLQNGNVSENSGNKNFSGLQQVSSKTDKVNQVKKTTSHTDVSSTGKVSQVSSSVGASLGAYNSDCPTKCQDQSGQQIDCWCGNETAQTKAWNAQMRPNSNDEVYTGGCGVFLRDNFDGMNSFDQPDDGVKVVPGAFLSNDLFLPNPTYGAGNETQAHTATLYTEVYDFLGYCQDKTLANNDMPDGYDKAVMYATDSNASDQRGRYEQNQQQLDVRVWKDGIAPSSSPIRGYLSTSDWKTWTPDNNAKGTIGFSMGNPYVDNAAGGGTGLHVEFSNGMNPPVKVNQYDAYVDHDNKKGNIIKNIDAQCPDIGSMYFAADKAAKGNCNSKAYSGKSWVNDHDSEGNCWDAWVDQLLTWGQDKDGNDISFPVTYDWVRDYSICWSTNPRDMINLQNTIYLMKDKLFAGAAFDDNTFWGWNEIPMTRTIVEDTSKMDAFIIILNAQNDFNTDSTNVPDKITANLDKKWLALGVANINNKPSSNAAFLYSNINGTVQNNLRYQHTFGCPEQGNPTNLGTGSNGTTYWMHFDGTNCYIDDH